MSQNPNLTPILGYATSVWQPTAKVIENISQSNPCIITTSTNHDYQEGIYVRIFLPGNFGMDPLNGKIFPATILSARTFSIPVDSRDYPPFTSLLDQNAQVLPSGEASLSLENAMTNITTVPPNAPLG